MKKSIDIHAGSYIDACHEIIDWCINSGIPLFDKDNFLVAVSTEGIQIMNLWHLNAFLSDYFSFNTFNKPIECPERLLRMLLSKKKWGLPVLKGISRAPYLFGKELITQPGYNERSKIYLIGESNMGKLPDHLNLREAKKAMAVLKDPFSSFPYAKAHGISVVISAVLTGLVRKNLYSAPLHAFTAPKMATGKSLLCSLISLIVSGHQTPVITQAENEAEESKRMLALLLEGEPLICIDNIERYFSSSALCSILTEPLFKGRILGKTQNSPSCSTAALFLANGNNLVIQGDLSSRTIICSLDAKMENPEQRHFKNDVRKEVEQNRPVLLNAAFTVLCAYLQEKNKIKTNTFGRFENWSSLIREAIMWCGMPDPCFSTQEVIKNDPVRFTLKRLLYNWHILSEGRGIRISEIIKMARNYQRDDFECSSEMKEAAGSFIDIGESLSASSNAKARVSTNVIGKFFARHEGRIEGGYKIDRSGKQERSERWQTTKVK